MSQKRRSRRRRIEGRRQTNPKRAANPNAKLRERRDKAKRKKSGAERSAPGGAGRNKPRRRPKMPTFSVATPPRPHAPGRAQARAQTQAPKQAQSRSARTGGRGQGGRPLFRPWAQAAAWAGVGAVAALLGGCAAPGLPAPSGPEFPINAPPARPQSAPSDSASNAAPFSRAAPSAPGSPSANGFGFGLSLGLGLSFPFAPTPSYCRHVPADRPQNAQARARGDAPGSAPV